MTNYLTIDIPEMPHKAAGSTDATYFRNGAGRLRDGYHVGGSNMRATVATILDRVADALENQAPVPADLAEALGEKCKPAEGNPQLGKMLRTMLEVNREQVAVSKAILEELAKPQPEISVDVKRLPTLTAEWDDIRKVPENVQVITASGMLFRGGPSWSGTLADMADKNGPFYRATEPIY